MRTSLVRARDAARLEPLEGRRLLSLTPTVTVADPTAPSGGCGCGGGHDAYTFHVDDDRQQCPDAEFTSIQAAVLAAPPFSTIYVCPGVYNEQVMVPKTLTLLGSSHDRSDARSADGPDPQHDSIVQFPTPVTGVFWLRADDIELDGFVIQGNTRGPGIYAEPMSSGYCIEYNFIRDNVFGLYLNSSGVKQTVVSRNDFNANNRPGAASGDGIYSDQGLHNALVEQNYFTNHLVAAMVYTTGGVPASTNQGIVVRKNAIIDDASVVFFNSLDVRVEQNFIRRNRGSGIFLGGGNNTVFVDNNLIQESGSTGINVTGAVGAGTTTGVVVTRTRIADAGRGVAAVAANGVSVNRTDGAVVRRNIILRANTDGIRLTSANSNLIADNLALHNGRDGIRVGPPPPAPQSMNNQIVSNTMRMNGEHDAHDDTVGGGTAGTANFWVDNNCKTENRPGLCGHSHDDDATFAAQEQSYGTSLSSDPVVGGDVVIPTFDLPPESELPLLPELDVLGLVPDVLTSSSDKPWLDAETT